MAWRRVIWSPIETEYLKNNRDKAITQLTIALAKSVNAVKNKMLELDGKAPKSVNRNRISRIGKRTDLGGLFLRSGWEANVARWFKYNKKNYEFEPENFPFFGVPGIPNVKRGTMNYVPDFKVPHRKSYRWVEVKGMLRNSDKTRIRRFKKYYPEEFKKLVVIVASEKTQAAIFFKSMNIPVLIYYNDLNKKFKNKIPHWE